MKKGEVAENLFIYDSNLLESIASDSLHIYVDATFKCPPKFLNCAVQMMTIMVKIENPSTKCEKV